MDESADWVLVPMRHTVGPNTTSGFNMGAVDDCLIDVKAEFDNGENRTIVGVNICKDAQAVAK
jgi:hypothetical protein